ncbi:MAG: hypothetical protein NZ898_10985 [Myxococcota bacterium]|nr:hypothetical protein [Myxococcota bacterium]
MRAVAWASIAGVALGSGCARCTWPHVVLGASLTTGAARLERSAVLALRWEGDRPRPASGRASEAQQTGMDPPPAGPSRTETRCTTARVTVPRDVASTPDIASGLSDSAEQLLCRWQHAQMAAAVARWLRREERGP